MCDDFSGYKALFERGIVEVGCMTHARRKFVELHVADKSVIVATALELIGQLYLIEREVATLDEVSRLH